MNVKLHTPKSLKMGSGMSSMKQFLLSLIATTISIVLTFGTAAIIDNNKKKAAKKEMVMMVISDFDKTIEIAQNADSVLRESRRLQHELVMHPEQFDSLRLSFIPLIKMIYDGEFSETTENIFSTSIETFNTIGDVNFVNDVSSFYMTRRKYKEEVLDKLRADLERAPISQSLKTVMDVSFPEYVFVNWAFMEDMKECRDKCMKMMKVTEKDMSKFSMKHADVKEDPDKNARNMEMFEECNEYQEMIEQAKEKLKD